MNERVKQWLISGDRGLSSNAILEVMEGFPLGSITGHHNAPYPHDGCDFRRCHMLLELAPEYKARLGEMRRLNSAWSNLVDRWDELTLLLEAGEYKRMYELITELTDEREAHP